ncbi:hypothetical protein GUJ93_ZPchr0067g6543 [Zizania palustris]|uniref:Association with the SNF1 complex (ASC) domain-containing protein n=1 Tax=Zizania palustris TaxID=103762 RepID=A0A8J5R2Y9_ZIZPA|nr:hypothetical protein GUJ93_ZPchr0067g6543 [Zizania palustris]
MGNASAKEGENGHVTEPPAAGVVNSAESATRSPPPDAVMRELPPPVPYLFAPQAPVVPLHRPTESSPVFNNSRINESDESTNNHPQEKGIPTLITWSQGGNEVFVEGSWDNWTSRRVLERSGKDHAILLVLPSGVYHYRIIVDGELKYVPELPHADDERGNVSNLLDVQDHIPESLDGVAEFDAPPSPDHSYGLQLPGDEEFAKEPPTLPPQLPMSVLGGTENYEEHAPKPKHVVLNHLFIEKGWGSQSLLALGVTHRFQSKYVSFVLYKPFQRNWTKADAEASSYLTIQMFHLDKAGSLHLLEMWITQTRNLGKEMMISTHDVDADSETSEVRSCYHKLPAFVKKLNSDTKFQLIF